MRRADKVMLLNRMRAKLVAPALEPGDDGALLNELNNLAQAISMKPASEPYDDEDIERRFAILVAHFTQWRVRQQQRVTPTPAVKKGTP